MFLAVIYHKNSYVPPAIGHIAILFVNFSQIAIECNSFLHFWQKSSIFETTLVMKSTRLR